MDTADNISDNILLDEINSVRGELDAAKKELEEARGTIAKLTEEVAAKDAELEKAQSENEKMKIQLRRVLFVEKAGDGVNTTPEEDRTAFHNIKEIHQQNLDLTFKITQMERDNAAVIEMRAKEMAAKDRIATANEYEIQLRQSKKEFIAARQECAKLKEDVALLEGRELMLAQDHRKQINALQEKLNLAEKNRDEALSQQQGEVTTLKQQLSSIGAQMAEKEAQLQAKDVQLVEANEMTSKLRSVGLKLKERNDRQEIEILGLVKGVEKLQEDLQKANKDRFDPDTLRMKMDDAPSAPNEEVKMESPQTKDT